MNSEELKQRARDCANGFSMSKTDKGDYGLFDDLVDFIRDYERTNIKGLTQA